MFSQLWICGVYFIRKGQKIIRKKFGGNEKMSTFAIPNEKRGINTKFVFEVYRGRRVRREGVTFR